MNNNWKSYELGNIVSIYNGSTPSTTNEEFWNGDIIWVTPKDLSDQNQKYISEGERKITRKALSKNKLLPKGTILLSSRAPIGLLSISLTELVTNQGFKNIVVDEKLLNNEFLYYNLKLRKNELNNLGTGTTFKELSKNTLEKFKINLPDLSTQKSIAKVLSDLDAKIELNNKINRELEAMAKMIYDYWFVQFDFPNEQGKPYKSSGGEMVYNSEMKREIPEGWEVKKLNKLFVFDKGTEPGSSEYCEEKLNSNFVKFYRVGDIHSESNGIKYVDAKINDYHFVNERDVLVTFDGSVGKLGYGLKGAYSSGLCNIYDKTNTFDNSLVYFIFKDERIIATIHKYATGSILLHASSSINHLTIPYNEKHYLLFQKYVKSNFDLMVKNKIENQQLSELRDWLLPMLMNGQVTVKENQ